jgi:plasmid stabilization system protein ParE
VAAKYLVILSSEARDDLDAITAYIGRESSTNAAGFIDRLRTAAMSLDEFPHRFRVRKHRRREGVAIRAMPFWPYLIYYRIVEESGIVRVLTVRHGARRTPKW